MEGFKVVFLPEGKKIKVSAGATVKDAMNDARLDFDFPCGGRGTCGKCRVRIASGLSAPTTSEEEVLEGAELAKGMRLACQTQVYSNIL